MAEKEVKTYFAVDSTEMILKKEGEVISKDSKGPDLPLERKPVMNVIGREIRIYIERNGF